MKHPCQVVLVRHAPPELHGGFVNLGVVVLVPSLGFCAARFPERWRIGEAASIAEAHAFHLRRLASAIELACAGWWCGGDVMKLDLGQRLDLLFALGGPTIARSHVMHGVTSDPTTTLRETYMRCVSSRLAPTPECARSDGEVWSGFEVALECAGVLASLVPFVVRSEEHHESFDHAWKNRHWHVARAVSLDLEGAWDITCKAAEWCGRIAAVEPERKDVSVILVLGMPTGPSRELHDAAERGIALLTRQLRDHQTEIHVDTDGVGLARRIGRDLDEQRARSRPVAS